MVLRGKRRVEVQDSTESDISDFARKDRKNRHTVRSASLRTSVSSRTIATRASQGKARSQEIGVIDSDSEEDGGVIIIGQNSDPDKENTTTMSSNSMAGKEPTLRKGARGNATVRAGLDSEVCAQSKSRWLLHVEVPALRHKIVTQGHPHPSTYRNTSTTQRIRSSSISISAPIKTIELSDVESHDLTSPTTDMDKGKKAKGLGHGLNAQPFGKSTKQRSASTSTLSLKDVDVTHTRPVRASRAATRKKVRLSISSGLDSHEDSDSYSLSSRTTPVVEDEDDDYDMPDVDDVISNGDSIASDDETCVSDDEQEDVKPIPVKRQRPSLKGPAKPRATKIAKASAGNPTLSRRNPPPNWNWKSGIDQSKEPLHDISDIFADMTQKAVDVGFKDVIRYLGKQKLKVATMCSGTESPLLALGMIRDALKKHHDLDFEIDHQFSAEIVPFKQAYIERNFHPKIIFRDIRELAKKDKASTAYGAPTAIPPNVDILIAGFSCVDFSNLNAWRKKLEDVGESGDTFRAILNYAKRYRPAIIVLENVCSAPWPSIKAMWEEKLAGYAASWVKLDTKRYYIPHTRQRGYMVCIDKEKLASAAVCVGKWQEFMAEFERPASSSVDAFLLDEDDPRLHRAREEMAKDHRGDEKAAREVDWTACQGRHGVCREENGLGNGRPCTRWVDGGSNEFFDYGWKDWSQNQVDRIKDTIEIQFLRNGRRGYDSGFKPRVWELSQNCDRFTDTTPFGITGCMTPTGQPYHTTRGGPIIGLEAVALQGLPINQLLLTRESQKELQDLAGNAMTSTVVGAAILSALIVGHKAITKSSREALISGAILQPCLQEIDDSVLSTHHINFGQGMRMSVTDLCEMATSSARRCYCEGQLLITTRRLLVCKECSHTACDKCGVIPSHHYTDLDPKLALSRTQPHKFADAIKQALPMRLQLTGISLATLEHRKRSSKDLIKKSDWTDYEAAVGAALGEELRFLSTKRSQFWTITYDASHSRLELVFAKRRPQWFLYVKPIAGKLGNSRIRTLLQNPVARMSVDTDDLLQGTWELCLPVDLNFPIIVRGTGELVKSWESRLGLREPFAEKMVWSTLHLDVGVEDSKILQYDLAGDYKLLPNCGTASGSLHIKTSSNDSEKLFLFLDPDRTGDPKLDPFVFSNDIRRLNYGDTRHIAARVEPPWRPSAAEGPESVQCSAYGRWFQCEGVLEAVKTDALATFAVPFSTISVPTIAGVRAVNSALRPNDTDCAKVTAAILSCRVPLAKTENKGWQPGPWKPVDQSNERETFTSFAWLTERIRDLNGFSGEWRPLSLPQNHIKCQVCAPDRPEIKWRRTEDGKPAKLVPYEDPRQAGPYERAIKARPAPFVTRVRIDDDHIGRLVIGLNVPTLAHRALAKVSDLSTYDGVELSWRLDTQYVWPPTVTLPRFILQHNKHDEQVEHVFQNCDKLDSKFALRPEQQRSLGWMVNQEKENASPFYEEEIEEACLPHIGWRAEARVTKPRHIHGGVLADEVGYGKTITTLALIETQKRNAAIDSSIARNGCIPLQATLIIVPRTLMPQWEQQTKQFLGNNCKVLIVKDMGSLARYSIANFQQADIIIAAWSIFSNDTYLRKFSELAALPEPPSSAGRAFVAWLGRATQRVSDHTDELKQLPFNRGFWKTLERRLQAAEDDENLQHYVPSKRLKGRRYVDSRTRDESDDRIDDEESKAGSKRKRSKMRPASKGDTFGLTKANKLDEIVSPLFQMFHFHRLVVDEFTYVDHKEYAFLTSLKASKRWVLSGTPPLDDFADIKIIAGFLGITLGIDDDARGVLKGQNIKAIRKERTAAEHFQSFSQSQSPAWHQHRQAHAQRFLNQFARQNTAEIAEIPTELNLEAVTLPAAERAIYLELQQQVYAQDMKSRKGNRSKLENDRSRRLNDLLALSKSPQEALLKRCSHFLLDVFNDDPVNAADACKAIVDARKAQRGDLMNELERKIRQATRLKLQCGDHDKHYADWKQLVSVGFFGDANVCKTIMTMIEEAEKEESKPRQFRSDKDVSTLRSLAETLRTLSNELLARQRALRFFDNVRQVQLWQSDLRGRKAGVSIPSCAGCLKNASSPAHFSIYGLCGHTACGTCAPATDRGTQCRVKGCDAAAFDYHMIGALELGQEDRAAQVGRHYGKKIEQIIHLIQHGIKADEQVLLFVQFDDLMEKISAALDEHQISHFALTEATTRNGHRAAEMMNAFQTDDSEQKRKVLMLNSGNESAAGANLTNANHVIFVSPLLSRTQHEFDASGTQCIGRARRCGQKKTVYVYRFLSLKTIDVDIIQQRTETKLVKNVDGGVELKFENKLTDSERRTELGSGFVKTLFSNDYSTEEDE